MSDQWFCIKAGIVNDETIGPISTADIAEMIQSGELNTKAKVASPTRTQNGWVVITTLPEFSVVLEEMEASRNQQKRQAQAARQQAAEQAQVAKQQRERERSLAAEEKRQHAMHREQERRTEAASAAMAEQTRGPQYQPHSYKALETYCGLLRGLGWLIIAVWLLAVLGSILMFFFSMQNGLISVFITMGSGILYLIPVFFFFILSDIIGLFLDIEENGNRAAFWAEVQARR